MKTREGIFGFLTALTLASAPCAFAQNPPNNDDFANRTVLTGSSITFTGTLVGATTEPTETYTNVYLYQWPFSRSVWWTWTAAESTTVVVAIQPDGWANNTNAWLEVYGGTNLALTLLWEGETHAGTAFTKPPCGYVRFQATAGTSYQIRVAGGTNSVGAPFTLQLTAANPPIFVAQPQNYTVSPYGSAFFGAIATGPQNFTDSWPPVNTYQWYFNGVPIPGEIYPSLLVHGVTHDQAGYYSVIASNVGGITLGGSAMLTVVDTNPVPRLIALPPTNSSLLSFSLTGEPGRWYKIESSTNLQDWINPIWLQLTNPATILSIQRLQSNHFVRASLDVPTDVCIARLKRWAWGLHIFAMYMGSDPSDGYTLPSIFPYVPKNSQGPTDICPEGGWYASGGTVKNAPTCSLSTVGHVIIGSP
jgi:hypothetical protein